MKKQNAYTIQDDIFLDALELIASNFHDVSYAIVGGGAVQVYVASIAAKQAQVQSLKALNGFSFVLRRTGDIDLSFHADPTGLIEKFNLIIAQAAGPYTFHSFTKRFVIQQGKRRFNLNYQLAPDYLKGYYADIIASALQVVALPYKQNVITVKVARPEYLIVSKLTRIKPKDQIDILLLLKAMELDQYPFDAEEVRSILKSVNKGENYDILLELMET